MTALEPLIYHEVTVRTRPGPANLFIQLPSAGPILALRLNHPTKTWVFDPRTVWARLTDDFFKGEDRTWRVDRARAEKIGLMLGAPLPDEQELRRLLAEGEENTAPPAR